MPSNITKNGHDPDTLTPGDVIPDERDARQHLRIYIKLRNAIRDHIASGQTPFLEATDPPLGGWVWNPSQAAVDAFQNARRNEEPEELAEQMNPDIRVESDNENYGSEASLEEEDGVTAETEDGATAGNEYGRSAENENETIEED